MVVLVRENDGNRDVGGVVVHELGERFVEGYESVFQRY